MDLETGEGYDCGRAAPGGGEILRTWRIGGKVYMASYASGNLVEYDPAMHPHFPENPHVVATPPHAMRPVADAHDGRHLWYASNNHYGHLGSTLTRYDTVTGRYTCAVKPLGDQQITSLWYDTSRDRLLAATTIHADCQSCPPTCETGLFAVFDPVTLEVRSRAEAPAGTVRATILAPLGDDRWLVVLFGEQGRFAELDGERLALTDTGWPVPANTLQYAYAGRPGWYLLLREKRVELWDMRERRCHTVLRENVDGYMHAGEGTVYVLGRDRLWYLDDVLGTVGVV